MNQIIKNDLESLTSRVDTEQLKNKTIMIVGANGLIGRYFSYYMLYLNEVKKLNMKIIVMARNIVKARLNYKNYLNSKNFTLIEQDVCFPINYDEQVDYILHAAGSADPNSIINNPIGIIKANTIGTINVMEFARKSNAKKVIFTSTREIYGKVDDNTTFIEENDIGGIDTLDSRSSYPESKRIAETILKAYSHQYNIPFNIARIAHTYGPTMQIDNDGRVMADFISFVVNNNDIILNSDGTALRSFCYITDTIAGLTKIMLDGKVGEAYNLANEKEPYPIKEIANKLVELFPEKNLKVILNGDSAFKKGGYSSIKLIQMNTKKLEDLGWAPSVSLVEGMKNTVMYFEYEKQKKL